MKKRAELLYFTLRTQRHARTMKTPPLLLAHLINDRISWTWHCPRACAVASRSIEFSRRDGMEFSWSIVNFATKKCEEKKKSGKQASTITDCAKNCTHWRRDKSPPPLSFLIATKKKRIQAIMTLSSQSIILEKLVLLLAPRREREMIYIARDTERWDNGVKVF